MNWNKNEINADVFFIPFPLNLLLHFILTLDRNANILFYIDDIVSRNSHTNAHTWPGLKWMRYFLWSNQIFIWIPDLPYFSFQFIAIVFCHIHTHTHPGRFDALSSHVICNWHKYQVTDSKLWLFHLHVSKSKFFEKRIRFCRIVRFDCFFLRFFAFFVCLRVQSIPIFSILMAHFMDLSGIYRIIYVFAQQPSIW